MPLNSGRRRQSFVGLVIANTASQWRWAGTVWEANEATYLWSMESNFNSPASNALHQLPNHFMVEWLCPHTSDRCNSSSTSPYSKCLDAF